MEDTLLEKIEIRQHSKKQHRLSAIPTAYEETQKIIDSKNIQDIEDKLERLEVDRRKGDEEAILDLINTHGKSKTPLVSKLSITQNTYSEVLNNLLSLRSPETFEAMMLLYEYMENKKNFTLDKLTGTELLKLGGYKGIRQIHRHRILQKIDQNSGINIKVLNPEESVKNYNNKKTDKGLVYDKFELIKVKKVVYSKRNPKLIKELVGVEFLPEYMKYIRIVSKRYIPLEAIRKIEKESSTDKSRHFFYKLCFKFGSVNGNECELTLDECMNLGKFFNKEEHSIKKKWKPIEKALLRGKKLNLIDFQLQFRQITESEKQQDGIATNLFMEITQVPYNADGTLKDEFYKYIKTVKIRRMYNLNAPKIDLPFTLEDEEPIKQKEKAEF